MYTTYTHGCTCVTHVQKQNVHRRTARASTHTKRHIRVHNTYIDASALIHAISTPQARASCMRVGLIIHHVILAMSAHRGARYLHLFPHSILAMLHLLLAGDARYSMLASVRNCRHGLKNTNGNMHLFFSLKRCLQEIQSMLTCKL